MATEGAPAQGAQGSRLSLPPRLRVAMGLGHPCAPGKAPQDITPLSSDRDDFLFSL